MATNANHHTNYVRSILEKEKLNHTNFLNWPQNLRIALKPEKKLYVLDAPIPDEPPVTPRASHADWSNMWMIRSRYRVSCWPQ